MKRGIFLFGIFFLAVAIGLSGDVTAGTMGKIVGKVVDEKGGPLPGANVVVEGTKLGATTDADGYYVILRVDPGLYSLAVSMIGYRKETKTDARVQADVTTEVNFTLKEVALELGELVVVAERPPVEVDKTFTKYTVGADEIEQIPLVRTTAEMVTLQPGVWLDGSDRIRGSNRPGEWRSRTGGDVAYYVDGVKLVNNDGGWTQNWKAINRSAVQEISVITGGMNAEYGNAQAGVINIVTKDGGQRYRGWMEYTYVPAGKKHWGKNVYDSPMHRDHMKWGDSEWENERDPVTGRVVHVRADYTGVSGHEIEGNLSGPITKGVSFMVTGRTSRRASTYPGPASRGNPNFQGSYSFTFYPTVNIKVKAGGVLERISAFNTSTYETKSGTARGLGDSGKNLFLPGDWAAAGKLGTLNDVEYLAITHSLSPRTFYDLRVSRYSTVVDTSDVPEATTDVRRDADGWFAVDRDIRRIEREDRKRYQVKFDLASQMTKGHFVKAGLEMIKYSMWKMRFTQMSPQSRRLEYAGAEARIQEPVHPLYLALYLQDKMEFEGMVINAGLRLDRFDPSSKFSAVANYAFSPMYDSPYRYQTAPMKDPKVFWNLSPRFGVSHPITSRSSMHYFAGLFLAYPDIYWLFNSDWRTSAPDVDWNGNGKIDASEEYNSMRPAYPQRTGFGTVDIRPEKTVSMEVGFDWNFVADYVAAAAVYYKSAKDQFHYHSDGRFYAPHKPGWVHKYARSLHNNGFEEQRGLELSLRKRFSDNFAFNVSYNMTWSQRGWGNFDAWFNFLYPDSAYIASGRYWIEYKIEGGREVPVPLTDDQIRTIGHTANTAIEKINKRDGTIGGRGYNQSRMTAAEYGLTGPEFDMEHLHVWARGYQTGLTPDAADIRNMGSVEFVYITPSDFGPEVNLFGSKLLSNWRVNTIWRMQNTGGFWYTPPNAKRYRRERPIRTWTDLSVEKRFPFRGGQGDVSLFLDVRNLFNQKDDSSFNTSDWVRWGLRTARPDNSDYMNYGDMADRSYYGQPRRVEFGLRASF